MAKQIIFRSLLLWYIILMISMANSVFCDNTPNDVTSTAESKDNLDISKMIKKYFEGSIDENEMLNFIKNNIDNFASGKELGQGARESEKSSIACMDQSWGALGEEQGVENELLECLRIGKTCQNLIDEKKLNEEHPMEECITKIANDEIDITSKGNVSYN